MSQPAGLRPFLTEFWRFDRRAALLTLGLNLAGAVLEGLGLMLLLPLLTLAGVFGGTAGPALSLPLPAGLTQTLDGLAPTYKLLLMLGLFVSLIALQAVVGLLRERHSQRLQLRFVDHLRDTLFGALAGARWRFLAQHHSSEFLNVLTTDVARVGNGTLHLLLLLTQLALLPVYLVVAFQLSPPVTGLALLTGAALWWVLRRSRDMAKQSGTVLSRANQALFSEIQEFLGALKLIKIHGEENGYQRQFAQVTTHLREHQLAFNEVRTRSQLAFRIGGSLALAALTYAALVWVQLPAANLLVLIAIFSRTLPQVSGIHMGLQQLWHMAPAFASWQAWVTRLRAHRDESANAVGSVTLTAGLHLSQIVYRHPNGSQAIEIPDLLIPARRTTAIIGQTGSGKTTLLDLLSGLNEPQSGSILIDGKPLRADAAWRRRLAYVPQDCAILDGTIRANLTWGALDADDARLLAALELAAAAHFVQGLPHGLDTWVGERGVRLSGGEKQRLALARALLREPELLILDEATSALDRAHQQIVIEALRRLHGRMTVLIVTHRDEEIRHLLDGVVRVVAGRVGAWEPLGRHATTHL
ncbi:ABC transporter ATP-binding protein [uncultured Thiodictyon sp.]|uniref:ATP-binding cassette domain-containing protein n=1 Tax=uncultured Thiodictyon sp. TaxID=1846217 RepID=UPI0025D0BDCC|nr:ABC transporter ATP-binding protein [uncultured Thiodictyon sp.]